MEQETYEDDKNANLLIPREKYLSAGVHIGMTTKTAQMKKFIYKVRSNGLAVLNVGMLDERIKSAAGLLSNKKRIMIVARRDSAKDPVKKFAQAIGAAHNIGRFMPGSLTNPTYKEFSEPQILILTDQSLDKQAVKEALQMRIPIIALADTSSDISYIDLVLPCNNKAKKSVALVLWLLAREIAIKRGEEFTATPEEFGYE